MTDFGNVNLLEIKARLQRLVEVEEQIKVLSEERDGLVQQLKGVEDLLQEVHDLVRPFRQSNIPQGTPIVSLGFPTRIVSCFRAERIQTLEDLLKKTRDDLSKIPNLGRISLNRIEEILEKRGLRLLQY